MNFREVWAKKLVKAAAGLIMLVSGSAFAAVLWSAQPPSTNLADGQLADSLAPLLSQSLPGGGGVTINSITWWGFYADSNSDPLAASASPFADDFVVTFNSGATAITGSLSKSIDAIGGGDLLTRYVLSGFSLNLPTAPTTLDIINNFNDGNGANVNDALWFWQGTAQGPLAYIIEGERATQQVPAPGVLVLFALGLAMLRIARTRKGV